MPIHHPQLHPDRAPRPLSTLRAVQLHSGRTARVEQSQKLAVTPQHEVAERMMLAIRAADPVSLPSD